MIPTDRFLTLAPQRQFVFQPESPVYVHCTRRSIERDSGAVFLQVRMVNCGQREISTVFLSVEGFDAFGKTVYRVPELPLTNCAAAPRGVFGEDRMLVLPRTEVERLRVSVERVVFADGTRWRRLPSHRLCMPQEAGYLQCICGFPNPPQRALCQFCGSKLSAPHSEPQASEIQPLAVEKPAPISRSFTPHFPIFEDALEAEETQDTPRWARILLYIFGGMAILAAIAFLTFCLIRFGNPYSGGYSSFF